MRTYDLIFGILAGQLGIVSRDELKKFPGKNDDDGAPELPAFLLERGALSTDDEALLQRLVDSVIFTHRGDESAALDAFGGREVAAQYFSPERCGSLPDAVSDSDKTLKATAPPFGFAPELEPESIGRYTGGSEFARGGIGRVLLVHDEQMGRDVVLKELLPAHVVSSTASTLSPQPAGDAFSTPMRQSAALTARFLREAKVTGQLEHPSIVPVYELGTRADGQVYYTMKLVRGETLASAIKACTSFTDRLALLRSYLDVCQALAYAHSKGVIHRDLKPSNIMVGEFGECVVLDWGLAKTKEDPASLDKTLNYLNLDHEDVSGQVTQDAEVLGTPLYMAPEQARSETAKVGSHSDVYALGVVLYEILSGELPHAWTNSQDTLLRVGNKQAPRLENVAPDTPPELAAICDKALRFDAGERYASAGELADDVRKFLEGAIVGAYAYGIGEQLRRLYREHRALINSVGLAALAVLTMGVLSYVSIYQARLAERDARVSAEAAQERTAREKYVSTIRLAEAHVRAYKFQAAEDSLLKTETAYRDFEWASLLAQCNRESSTLRGHTKGLFAFLSHDGAHILTVSGDRSARLWDSASDSVLHTWTFPEHRIVSATFSGGDERIAVWMFDGTIVLLDPSTGERVLSWKGHPTQVNNCVFNPTGELLFSGGTDHTVRAWDMKSETPVLVIEDLPGAVTQLRFTHNGARLLAACADGLIRQFDAVSGALIATSTVSGRIADAGLGQVAVLVESDVVLLDEETLVESGRFRHGSSVARARLYPDEEGMLTASRAGIVRYWNLDSGEVDRLFHFQKAVSDCHLSEGRDLVVAMARDGELRVWNRQDGTELNHFGGHRGAVTTLALAPDDAYLLTGSWDSTAKKWPLRRTWDIDPLLETEAALASVAIARDGEVVAYATADGLVRVVDLSVRSVLYEAAIPARVLGSRLAIDRRASRVALVLDDFLAVVISIETGEVVSRLRGHEGTIRDIRFGRDGEEVVTASTDHTVKIWDSSTGELKGELVGHEAPVAHVSYVASGAYLATASLSGVTRVWDRESLALLFDIPHNAQAGACTFSADGQFLAAASRDGRVQIWAVADARKLHELEAQMGDVYALSFSPNGRRLLSASADGAIRIWDMETGLLLSVLAERKTDQVQWLSFTRGGRAMLTATLSGTILESYPAASGPLWSTTDREALIPLLEESKRSRPAALAAATEIEPATTHHVLVPQPRLESLLHALGTEAATDLAGMISGNLDGYYPIDLRNGDRVAEMDGMPLQEFFGSEDGADFARRRSAEGPLALLVQREAVSLNYLVTGLSHARSERNVNLSVARATAALDEGLEAIRRDADTLIMVNRAYAERMRFPIASNRDSLAGYVVGFPREPTEVSGMRALGLQSGERITKILDDPVHTLGDLRRLCTELRESLVSADPFAVQFTVERGLFETITLNLVTANGN
jgi:eukaryotic-like serine/threonine-protein kinase